MRLRTYDMWQWAAINGSEELGDYVESSCKGEVGQNLRDSQILKDLRPNAVSVGIMKRIVAKLRSV
jgi:hypothetical protein